MSDRTKDTRKRIATFLLIITALSAIFYVLIGAAGTVEATGSLVSDLGEEIGWRGFLVLELAKANGFARTLLISGAIWAV